MMKYFFVFAMSLVAPCFGEVRLPHVIGSHMVLQRSSEVTIWGWAEPDENVTAHADWLDADVATQANQSGQWRMVLRTNESIGPHSLTLRGNNTIELNDVMFGEVWLASGQSNMEMPLVKVSNAYTGIKDSKAEVADADYPNIRLFQVGNYSSNEPLDDVQPGIVMYGVPKSNCEWQACSPQAVATFSSTAYFFARQLHQQLDVPIGIIDASWGGTSAEAWTPVSGLEKLGYAHEVTEARDLPQQPDQKIPSRLYNGMIHPLRNWKIQGAIWYQGEGNTGRAGQYHELFSTMIDQWRTVWRDDFSFYFVQISPFNYRGVNAAFLREAQLQTTNVHKTGMAVTMDIGNLTDIHPKNKQEVGRRLALLALAKDYGKSVVYSGPVYKQCVVEGDKIRVRFTHAESGLTTRDKQTPSHFEIAGSDKTFHAATATIDGKDVVVHSPKVPEPVAVRYAFTSNAEPNLVNQEGLPASSFRTDSWNLH